MRYLALSAALVALALPAQDAYAQWEWEVLDLGFADVQSQPEAMQSSLVQGEQVFATYCSVCHSDDGTGMPGVPNLVDQETLWGNDLAAIAYVVKYGIRSGHEKARFSQMPAYGSGQEGAGYTEELLTDLTNYLAHLRGESAPADSIARAENTMYDVCSECHGFDFAGQVDWYGAPSLLDDVSLYGHDDATVYDVIANGREGQSPVWENILSDEQIRDVSLYIESIRD